MSDPKKWSKQKRFCYWMIVLGYGGLVFSLGCWHWIPAVVFVSITMMAAGFIAWGEFK